MKTQRSIFKYAGVMLCCFLLFYSCSDNNVGPTPSQQLVLKASATKIDKGETVTFTVTAEGKTVKADIYIDGQKISGTKYTFNKSGIYKAVAQKAGYANSKAVTIKVYLTNVYVAGYEETPSGLAVAKYWKNGEPVTLTDGSNFAFVYDMYVSNGDVYVSGFEINNAGAAVAKYWKNGQSVVLTDSAVAASIIVSDGDVHVVGYKKNRATYWKNGDPVVLSDDVSRAYSMVVSEGDIYAAGAVSPNVSFATYWKNGNPVTLNDGTYSAIALSIFVSGEDVYVAGYQGTSTVDRIAVYWKNGESTILANNFSKVNSIFISEGDAYFAGFEETNNGVRVAKYWKNGEPVPLTVGSNRASSYSIVVFEGDVYVAGYEENSSGVRVAKYWKNGEPVPLTDGSNRAGLYSIVVTKTVTN